MEQHNDAAAEMVVLSDVHLTEIVSDSPPGWWTYKSRRASQDRALVGFLLATDSRRPEAFSCTHVLFNGDTWDFDSVYSMPDGVRGPPEGMPMTAIGSLYKMQRLLDDHPRFVAGLAEFLARGNRVTFLMGNHDRELAFPGVQDALRGAICRASPPGFGHQVAQRVTFEPWFVHCRNLLYVEHGQQYDATCSYHDVLHPFTVADSRHDEELDASLGSVMGRLAISRMGTFNPFDDDSFLQSLFGYVRHWWVYYFPRRPIVRHFLAIVALAFYDMRSRRGRALRMMERQDPSRYDTHARAHGVDDGFIAMLKKLASVPVSGQLGQLIHELWLDRLFVMAAAVALLVVGVTQVETWVHGLLLLTLLPTVALVLRAMGRGSLALQERGRWGLVAEHISAALDVPIVAFGHSHRPERRPLLNGGRYYNLGTWAPVEDPEAGALLYEARRFLVVRRVRRGRVHVAFEAWTEDGDPQVRTRDPMG